MSSSNPVAAAGTTGNGCDSSSTDDERVQQQLVVVEQLTKEHGFSLENAQKAIAEVGPDLDAALKYAIEKKLQQDQGGSVVPKNTGFGGAAGENGQAKESENHEENQQQITAELEPKKKKPRPSYDNLVELEASEREASERLEDREESEDDDDDNNNNTTTNDEAGNDDEDDEDSNNSLGSDISPSIIEIAAAVARGVPIDLFQADVEDEEIDYPFGSLPTSLDGVAEFMLSDKCKSIVILAGAGMSVASGIPDFRSADGLYATMNPDLLTANPVEREAIRMDPTVALEQGMFLQNPFPCLELQREFILGTHSQRWKATLAHRFVELLHAKTGKLVRLYTQNIDGLEDQCTQLPKEKRIAVHGSMDRAECARCGEEQDYDEFCERVRRQIKDLSGQDESAPPESTPIPCPTCGYNAMKPAIVLFRSSLPKEFFEKVPEDVVDADMLIVMGTSLRVAPANSLVWRVPKRALRLLVNREPIGWHLGVQYGEENKRDFFAPGDCDTVLLDLMTHLGWLDDLRPLLEGEPKLPDSSAALLGQKLGGDPDSNHGERTHE